jgi:hypothetical protein
MPPAGSFPPRCRLPLMGLGVLALLGALLGGLARLGWGVPTLALPVAAFHGPLMVSGFLGTLIALERAVALGRPLAYLAPLATGLGGLALAAGLPPPLGALLTTAGSAGVVVIFAVLLRRQPALFTAVMALGAAAWLAGQALWLAGWPVHRVVFWWAGFLVLTIAGERLELARLVRVSAAGRAAFLTAVGLFAAGLVLTLLDGAAGVRVLGAGLLGLALWLGREDVARRTVRQPGLTRFIALSLLSGYVWLGVSGILAVVAGDVPAGPWYDAMLHALFLGFVFAMIFGHAPVIFPAVLGWPVRFRPAFYVHLAGLHLTLALRVAGDLLGWLPGRRWGGLLNAAAVLVFFANTAAALTSVRPRPAPRP